MRIYLIAIPPTASTRPLCGIVKRPGTYNGHKQPHKKAIRKIKPEINSVDNNGKNQHTPTAAVAPNSKWSFVAAGTAAVRSPVKPRVSPPPTPPLYVYTFISRP